MSKRKRPTVKHTIAVTWLSDHNGFGCNQCDRENSMLQYCSSSVHVFSRGVAHCMLPVEEDRQQDLKTNDLDIFSLFDIFRSTSNVRLT